MFKSLKLRLIVWYISSLTILALFFYIFVHDLAWKHGTHVFIILFVLLALIGSFIIRQIIRSIDSLTGKIQTITYKNLDERVTNISGDDEISQLARAFNKLLDRLDEGFKREQQFIADVAHELKTPLSVIRSSFEIALEKKRTIKQYQKIIEGAIEETDQMSSTLKNVLDLAWSETPNADNMHRFELSSLLEELSDITSKMGLSKKITVKSTIAKGVEINGYKDKLARALLNICENAIKYNRHRGKVVINMEVIHSKAIISIKDTGVGIAKEDMGRIFNRFYRGSKTDKVFGAGLGLAISKSMILLHKGDIKVNSQLGQGSTFIISLPVI